MNMNKFYCMLNVRQDDLPFCTFVFISFYHVHRSDKISDTKWWKDNDEKWVVEQKKWTQNKLTLPQEICI